MDHEEQPAREPSHSHVLGIPQGEAGYLLLQQLGLDGWSIGMTPCVMADGEALIEGWNVSARRGELLVERAGRTIADVAPIVFESARQALHAAN